MPVMRNSSEMVWRGLGSRAARGLLRVIAIALSVFWMNGPASAQERVEVRRPEDLLAFFEKLNYTHEAWEAGIRDVPRVYMMDVSERWKVTSRNIAVIQKKRIFFRALGPLVLRGNEKILADRERLLSLQKVGNINGEDAAWLGNLAQRYKVAESADSILDRESFGELVNRVDVVPVSLVLAQGADESGWGTSHFVSEGNALFGQWTWGGKGIKPKEQRKGMGDYRIAAFDTPLASVEAYLLNINTNPAYAQLRARRAEARRNGEERSGWELAKTLTSYSERGADYVDDLRAIMRVNKLQATDDARLVGEQVWEIYPVD